MSLRVDWGAFSYFSSNTKIWQRQDRILLLYMKYLKLSRLEIFLDSFLAPTLKKGFLNHSFHTSQPQRPIKKFLDLPMNENFLLCEWGLKTLKENFYDDVFISLFFGTTGNMLKLKRYRSLLAQKFTWLIIFHSRFEHQAIIKQLKDVSQPIFMLSVPCFNRIWRR